MRSHGHAVESICRVLREQGCQIAARTYRAAKAGQQGCPTRAVTDAQTVDAIREVAWAMNSRGQRVLAPEGLCGRRKMFAHLQRTDWPGAELFTASGSIGLPWC